MRSQAAGNGDHAETLPMAKRSNVDEETRK